MPKAAKAKKPAPTPAPTAATTVEPMANDAPKAIDDVAKSVPEGPEDPWPPAEALPETPTPKMPPIKRGEATTWFALAMMITQLPGTLLSGSGSDTPNTGLIGGL